MLMAFAVAFRIRSENGCLQHHKTLKKNRGIGYLTLNRPEVRNAINQEMIDEILEPCGELKKMTDIRVLIITGAGKAFQAGADIAELSEMKPMDILRWNEGIVRINAGLEKLRSAGDRRHQRGCHGRRSGTGHLLHLSGHGRVRQTGAAGSQTRNHPRDRRHPAAAPANRKRPGGRTVCSQAMPSMPRRPTEWVWSTGWHPDGEVVKAAEELADQDHGQRTHRGGNGKGRPRNRQGPAPGTRGPVFPEKLCDLFQHRGHAGRDVCLPGKTKTAVLGEMKGEPKCRRNRHAETRSHHDQGIDNRMEARKATRSKRATSFSRWKRKR